MKGRSKRLVDVISIILAIITILTALGVTAYIEFAPYDSTIASLKDNLYKCIDFDNCTIDIANVSDSVPMTIQISSNDDNILLTGFQKTALDISELSYVITLNKDLDVIEETSASIAGNIIIFILMFGLLLSILSVFLLYLMYKLLIYASYYIARFIGNLPKKIKHYIENDS